MFIFKKKKQTFEKKTYDHQNQIPVIRCSICTGEQTAGFKHLQTGKFQEIMLIRDDSDLNEFIETYDLDINTIKREY